MSMAFILIFMVAINLTRSQSNLQCLNDFRAAILIAHNSYRALHGAPALQQDTVISNTAQAWATNLAQKNLFQHSNAARLGENLFKSLKSSPFSLNSCASN